MRVKISLLKDSFMKIGKIIYQKSEETLGHNEFHALIRDLAERDAIWFDVLF